MNNMGKGVAQKIKNTWKQVYEADCMTVKGDATKLGTYTSAVVDIDGKPVTVINGYTQYQYNAPGVLADYVAIKKVMQLIKQNYSGKKIIMSKIGCGLAKGDWDVVQDIINTELQGEDVTVAEYSKPV